MSADIPSYKVSFSPINERIQEFSPLRVLVAPKDDYIKKGDIVLALETPDSGSSEVFAVGGMYKREHVELIQPLITNTDKSEDQTPKKLKYEFWLKEGMTIRTESIINGVHLAECPHCMHADKTDDDKWIRTEDGLPEKDGSYLVVFNGKGKNSSRVEVLEFNKEIDGLTNKWTRDGGGYYIHTRNIAYWQTLPSKPENSK